MEGKENAVGLIAPIAIAAGIAVAFFCDGLSRYLLLVISALLLAFSLTAYIILLYKGKSPVTGFRLARFHWLWVSITFVAFGLGTMAINRPDYLPECKNATVIGEVKEILNSTTGDHLTVEIYKIITKTGSTIEDSNLCIVLKSDAVKIRPGDIIAFHSELAEPMNNPNFINTGYSSIAKRKGISGIQEITSTNIHVVGHNNSLRSLAFLWREKIGILLDNSGLKHSTSDFLNTILLGDKSYLNARQRQNFSDAGIAHILAVSGVHVAIIAGLVFLFLFPLNFFGLYKWRYILTLPLVWIFVFITGFGYSSVRAAIMVTFAFCAIICERRNSALTALGWAAFFILLFSPLSLFDIGFQLSFLCVAALIEFSNRFNPIDHRRNPKLYKVIGMIVATLVATGASWILIAYHFERVPVLFLPANLIVIPILPLYLTIAVIHLLFFSISGEPVMWSIWTLDKLHSSLEKLTAFISQEGDFSFHINVGFGSVALWIVGILALAVSLRKETRRKRYISLSVAILTAAVISIPVLAETKEESGLIVCNSYREIKLNCYASNVLKEYVMPRKCISKLNCSGKRIMCIDCPLEPDGVHIPESDVIIIGSGFKDKLGKVDSLVRTTSHVRPIYILHNSMRKRTEDAIRKEADSLSLNVYSLRYDGPWRRMDNK